MKITIKEVAERANVSPSTVSRVISNSSQISEKTKERVREVIEELNYKPNAIARSLANKKSRIIGVVIPSEAEDLLINPFFIQAMRGMSRYAQNKKYYITYAFSENENNECDYLKDFINSNLISGVCLLRVKTKDAGIEFLKNTNTPFVVIGRPEDSNGMLWVDNDNFKATYNIVNKLIENGHKDIAFIGAKEELIVTKDRLNGFKVACQINGIQVKESNIIMVKEFNQEEGAIGTIELLKNNNVTAIIVEDDLLAFGALSVLNERNISNIAVVGFNNTQLAEYQNPPLSSVDINAFELGYHAAKLLIESIENDNIQNDHYIVESKLIERESMK